MVDSTGTLAVRGTVVWLTPQQGGRVSGPPEPDFDYDYTATAYLPPLTADAERLGIALRGFAPGAWRSSVEGALVAGEDHGPLHLVPGAMVVITEGTRPVGLLTVEEIETTTDILVPLPSPAVEDTPSNEAALPVPPPVAVEPTPAEVLARAAASDVLTGETPPAGEEPGWHPSGLTVATTRPEADPPYRHDTAATRWASA